MATSVAGEFAQIGKSVAIKGEISGSEDLYVDGQLQGSIDLSANSLTVGPNGRVHANIKARNVTISGTLDGNIQASERTDLRKTAVVNGDVQTRRIAIEDGAYFKGKLEIVAEAKSQTTPASSATAPSGLSRATSGASEPKK
jgi:cytoskeletal protein CcmA (bactofilin family)